MQAHGVLKELCTGLTNHNLYYLYRQASCARKLPVDTLVR